MWIIGDVFLTEAVAVLTQMQGLEKDQLYLYQAYDVKVFYPKKQCSDTFGRQVRYTLYQGLAENNKLPAVLLIVIGNNRIDDLVSTPYHTKRIWNTLFTEIDRAIKARKNDLPRKCFLNEEPRVFVVNVYPRFKDHCEQKNEGFDTFKTKRRRINNILPQISQKYGFNVITVNGIIPDNEEFFELSTGKLSGKGMREYWNSVSRELKVADETIKEKIRNDIIKSYLDDRKQEEKIQTEKREFATERSRLSDSNNFTRQNRLDRGDNRFNNSFQWKPNFRGNRFNRGHSANR